MITTAEKILTGSTRGCTEVAHLAEASGSVPALPNRNKNSLK